MVMILSGFLPHGARLPKNPRAVPLSDINYN